MLYYLLHSLVSSMLAGIRGYCACLYFSFLDQYLGKHEEIVLASLFCFQINLRRHTRRSCLPFFSYWVNLHSITFLSDRSLLANMTGVSALLQRFGWDDQSRYFLVPVSYGCTIRTRWCSHCTTDDTQSCPTCT